MFDSFVCWDLETTGFSSRNDEFTQIAATEVVNGEIGETWSCYIDIYGDVPQKITELTGITKEILKEKGFPLADAMRQFREFCGKSLMVSHNGKTFDKRFLEAASQKTGIHFANNHLDSMLLAAALSKSGKKYKLGDLFARCQPNMVLEAHRADNDTIMLAHVMLACLPHANERALAAARF